MLGIAVRPITIFLDFNAVILNLDSLSSADQKACISIIEANVKKMKLRLKDDIADSNDSADIHDAGKAVMQQQYLLAEAIEKWIEEIKKSL